MSVVAEALGGARVIVVVGPGGVGKTTTAAAIAVRRAEEGRRTIVLTVDPARRLASALGLPDVPGDPVRIRGLATLEAMQLDTKRTLDALVARHAATEDQRDRILANRFYARIADTLAGTHEYMAMEKLYELASEGDHEAIVVDTPPTRSALSFLDAPRRMTDFLGGRFLRFLLVPTSAGARGTLRLTALGAQAFGRAVRAITGAELLADTAEFLAAFEGMYDGFKQRAAAVLDLLRQADTRFVVVTAPEPGPLDEAGYFAERLGEAGMPLAAVVANRSHAGRAPLPERAAAAVPRLERGAPAARALAAAMGARLDWQAVESREAAALRAFHERHGPIPLTTVPEVGGDIHDLPGLRRLAAALFEPSA